MTRGVSRVGAEVADMPPICPIPPGTKEDRRPAAGWDHSRLSVVLPLIWNCPETAGIHETRPEKVRKSSQSRWGIETVFHQITDVFSWRHLIGTMPKAVLFQLSFCLLLYNALQVVRAHLASFQECEAKTISNEKLFYDVKRQFVAVSELVDVEPLLSLLGEVPTAAELRVRLRDGLRGAWSDRWWKARSSGRGGHQEVKT